jgi:MtN3 and saliva related transmembrane protein
VASPALLGWAATALSLTMRIPQLVRTLRLRDSLGLSRLTWLLSALSATLWVVYGVLIGSGPVVVTDGWALAAAITIAVMGRTRPARELG